MKPKLDTESIRAYCRSILHATERYEAFSKAIDVSSSTIEQILNGEKLIMIERAEELLKLLKE